VDIGGFRFCMQVLEVIVVFVFTITGASGVGIRNRDRHLKSGLESYHLKVTRSAKVHIQFGQISV